MSDSFEIAWKHNTWKCGEQLFCAGPVQVQRFVRYLVAFAVPSGFAFARWSVGGSGCRCDIGIWLPGCCLEVATLSRNTPLLKPGCLFAKRGAIITGLLMLNAWC